eukprot:1619142-Rhodomonas_salina.3
MGSSAHEFTLPDRTAGGYGWTDLCFKCSKPFVGGFLGAPRIAADCKAFACQTCAANRLDWDMGLFGCSAANTATTYARLEEVHPTPPVNQAFPRCVLKAACPAADADAADADAAADVDAAAGVRTLRRYLARASCPRRSSASSKTSSSSMTTWSTASTA